MIFISKYLVPKGYTGFTLYPFVLLKFNHLRTDYVLINHERIHLKQQLELLVLPFFILYGFEFLIRLIQLRNWNMAYRRISFEREAYQNEINLDYLETRRHWEFLKYV